MKISTAAIYVRLSKEDLNSGEHESESIQNQKSMLIDYAKKNQWEIYKIYCDEDYSGAYAGSENIRPEFKKMITDAEEKKFEIVLCKSQSRFSRNMEVIEQYIHGRFTEWGIRFVSLIDNADTNVRGNKKARQINSLINEWYLEDLSENIKAVFRDKMKKGEYLATFPPYGYSKDPINKNHLVINPQTSIIVKQIFDWHSEGYGAAKISRMLNDRDIPNPRKQQEISGLRKTFFYSPDEKGVWSTTTVGDILNNQVYCGDVVQHTKEKVSYKSRVQRKVDVKNQIIISDMHEPIISREIFSKTQQRLGERRKASGTGKVHMLSGKVFCYYCGKPMQKNHSKNNIEYLRCRCKYSYAIDKCCPTPNIRMDKVLEALQIQLIEKFKDKAVNNSNENVAEFIMKKNKEKNNFYKAEFSELNREKEQIERCLRNLYNDRLNDIIQIEQYVEYNNSFSERLNKINERIFALQDGADEMYKEHGENQNKNVKDFLEAHGVDKVIIDNLIEKIEFGEINSKTGNPILKVFWALD